MTLLILGSRAFQPLDLVDDLVGPAVLGSGGTISFGSSAVSLRAESLGAVRKPLETTRTTLLEMASIPGNQVMLFVARDPVTKQPTEGIAGIQHLLEGKGIPFEVVSSPFPGRICTLITDYLAAVDKAVHAAKGQRQLILTQKALALAAQVVDARDEFKHKLEESKSYGVGDEKLDAKWSRWVLVYCALCDALNASQDLLAVNPA